MATENLRGRGTEAPLSPEPLVPPVAPDPGTEAAGEGARPLTPDHTLNEIVALLPGAEGPLLHLGYDTCCGGSRSLREASDALGLDPDAVLDQVTGGVGRGRVP